MKKFPLLVEPHGYVSQSEGGQTNQMAYYDGYMAVAEQANSRIEHLENVIRDGEARIQNLVKAIDLIASIK